MQRILLASHGPLAGAMKTTLELLIGPNERITSLCAYVDESSMDVSRLVDTWEKDLDPADDWIVVTDIFGGSVNNDFLVRMHRSSFRLIAGMNLPLLVELTAFLGSIDDDLLRDVVQRTKGTIAICSAPSAAADERDDDF